MKFTLNELIEHSKKSVELSNNNKSKLNNDILNLEGMSGIKTRHLYNNICNLSGANYFEIGTWKGSSFISSIYDNNIKSLAVDNWSEFNGPKNQFLKNLDLFCKDLPYNLIEKDCFKLTKEEINNFLDTIDIYLYDGAHDYESHKKAITYFTPFLSKYSIIIIDDWRHDDKWNTVQPATYEGFKESNLIIHEKIEIITQQEHTGPQEYWNGFGLFVCEKID